MAESPKTGDRTTNHSTTFIRPARASDAAGIATVERSASKRFALVPELVWLSGAEPRAMGDYEDLIAAGCVLVAESPQGEVLGFIAAEMNTDTIHIVEISVSIAWQGQGVGRALFDSLASHGVRSGQRRITLTTFKDVPWNAPLYQRWGFLEIACPTGRLFDILNEEERGGLAAIARVAMHYELRGVS